MTRTIRMKDIAGLKANATTAPFVTTEPAKIGGVRGNSPVDPPPSQGLIFSESFNDLPDTTSNDGLTQALIDDGWTSQRQGGDDGGPKWTPEDGYPNGHYPYEILAADSAKARGGSGKAMVCWRESWINSSGNPGQNSDGQLSKKFTYGSDEMFVRFHICFAPGAEWTWGGQSKICRIGHLDEGGDPYSFFSDGDSAPIYIFNYGHNDFGARHFHSLRADPQETNYSMNGANPEPIGLPANMVNQGDLSLNFDGHIRDIPGNVITMTDKTTGEVLAVGPKNHDQIWGDTYSKVEIYVKMNSTPGTQDGILKVWIRDQLVLSNETMPWLGTNSPGGIKWNMVSIGGNDNFGAYENSEAAQEWYAIDDLEIYDSLPEGMI